MPEMVDSKPHLNTQLIFFSFLRTHSCIIDEDINMIKFYHNILSELLHWFSYW